MTLAAVPVRASPHRVQADDGEVEAIRWGPNLPDLVALEAGRAVADETLAVGVGGDRADAALRAARRYGADRALQVQYDPIELPVPAKYAAAVATVAASRNADAVVFGERSPLQGSETGTLAGDELDWPTVTNVTAVGPDAVGAAVDPGDDEVVVQRSHESGEQEVLVVEKPCAIVIQGNYANPRRAPLSSVVEAQREGLETVDLESVLPGESRFSMSVGRTTVRDVTPDERWGGGDPPRRGPTEERIAKMLGRGSEQSGEAEMVDGDDPAAAADAVVAYLRRNDLL